MSKLKARRQAKPRKRRLLSTGSRKKRGETSPPFPTMVPRIAEARALSDGMRKTGPHSKRMAEKVRLADSLLGNMEQYSGGDITLDAFQRHGLQIPERFRPQPPPGWLPQELGWDLLGRIRRAEEQQGGAAEELLRWVKWHLANPRGRPRKLGSYWLGQQAAELHASGRSWLKIAHKLCTQRGPDHTCTKACADRLRMAANEFKER